MESKEQRTDYEFDCMKCKKQFSTYTKFKKHLDTHNLTCDKCNKDFKNFHQKRLHDRNTHPQTKEKKCRVCPELSFKTEENYLLHIRDVHKGKFVDCYMCNVCGRTFKTRSELTQHINSKCGTVKQFTCKICGQKLMTPGSLYNHMRRHIDKASFMCRFCAKLFLTAGQLKVHERIHTQQKDFVCNVCGKGFCHRQSLITHSSVHTGIKPYQCEGCGKSFSCVGNLLKHRKTHADSCGVLPLTTHRVQNPSTKIKVRINTPASSRLKRLMKHKELQEKFAMLDAVLEKNEKSENTTEENSAEKVEEINYEDQDKVKTKDQPPEINSDPQTEPNKECSDTDENRTCDSLNDDLVNQNDLEKSIKQEDMEQKDNYDSKEDSGSFSEESNDSLPISHLQKKIKRKKDPLFDKNFNTFIKERKLENLRRASCKYCNKEYTQFRWLYKHEQDHEKNDNLETGEVKSLPFKCSCCRKCFETKDEVKQHQQLVHSDILTCHDCGDKIFANTDSLRSHKLIFHAGVPKKEYIYICDKCGRQFKQKLLLQVHNETDCGTGSLFQCQFCQKEFSSNHSLKTHLRIHTSSKNLVCKFCNKSFHWKGQLKVHERSHTGEKPYTCLFCPSAFAYRDSLITHSTLHTGIKPYFCKACGWRFSCIGNLIKHKVSHASTCGTWYQKTEREETI